MPARPSPSIPSRAVPAPTTSSRQLTRPTLGTAGALCLAAVATAVGLGRLSDNSFFTHLATGRLILDSGHIPTVDPYSFTAPGHSWVVQSWLPSLLYAWIERLAGATGLRLMTAVLIVTITALVWRLARPAEGIIVRLGIGGLVLGIGAAAWSERPFLFGLVLLGLTMLAAEDGLDPRWLVPLGWVWVNSHGSFPLGVVYLVVVVIGGRLDSTPIGVESRAMKFLVSGVLLGAVNPIGPRILLFPLDLLKKQDVLRFVGEWQAPTFVSTPQRIFLLQVMIALIALVRRPSYRSGLVVVVFTAAALLGARNLTVASLVLVPVIASAWPNVGGLRSSDRGLVASAVTVVSLCASVVVATSLLSEPAFDLRAYPTASLAFIEQNGVDLHDVRLAHPDLVGNYLELLHGAKASVFYDDRFDMFPREATDAHLALITGGASWRSEFERWRISLVVIRRSDALTQTLSVDGAWRTVFNEDNWVLFCRRGAHLGGALSTC